jgi:hypothetical protein
MVSMRASTWEVGQRLDLDLEMWLWVGVHLRLRK